MLTPLQSSYPETKKRFSIFYQKMLQKKRIARLKKRKWREMVLFQSLMVFVLKAEGRGYIILRRFLGLPEASAFFRLKAIKQNPELIQEALQVARKYFPVFASFLENRVKEILENPPKEPLKNSRKCLNQ